LIFFIPLVACHFEEGTQVNCEIGIKNAALLRVFPGATLKGDYEMRSIEDCCSRQLAVGWPNGPERDN
jgi:hypothetical protein